MGIVSNIKAGVNALKVGEELSKPATWKDRQVLGAQFVVLLSLVIPLARHFGFDLHLSGDETYQLAGTLAAVGYGAFNWYLTLATSRKVGTDAKPSDPADSARNAGL